MTGRTRHKFLAPAVLAEATTEIAILAKDERVQVALIGGYAMQLYGSDRLTGDVDVAAYEPIEELPVGKSLSFGGFQTKAPNGAPVDIVIRDDEYAPLYEEVISKAIRTRLAAMPVARAEYIAAMKMAAWRGKDDLDLQWLIANKKINERKTRKIIAKYLGLYAADEFDRLVDEVRWKVSRGRL
jgi:hypothetical protein